MDRFPAYRALALTLPALLWLPLALSAAPLKTEWKNGLNFGTEDGQTKMKIGGRLQQDWAFLAGDDDLDMTLGNLEDGTEFRRLRLAASGVIDGIVEFKVQLDFAKGPASHKDVYAGLRSTPLGGAGLRVGHFKQPQGLEELTSSNYILAMERSPTAMFAPSRKSGFMLHDDELDGQLTWAVSTFRDSDGVGKAVSDDYWSYAGRVTAQPFRDDDGNRVHLGVSASRRESADMALELDAEPEVHLHPEFGTLMAPADFWTVLGGEVATVQGPFHAQAEFTMATTTAPEGSEDGTFSAFYGMISWFLTGETMRYKESNGTFDRVKPQSNYGVDGGKGALQLVARYSHLDLADGALDGGEIDAITLGANWYLNPNARVMANYVMADGEGDANDPAAPNGSSQTAQFRFQVNF